jgi:outer membrane protein TolC
MRAAEARGLSLNECDTGVVRSACTGSNRRHFLPIGLLKRIGVGFFGATLVLLSPHMQAQTPVSAAVSEGSVAAPGVQSLRLTPIALAQMLALRSLELTYGRESVQVANLLAEAERALYEPVLFMSARVGDTQRQRTVEEQTSNIFTQQVASVLKEKYESLEVGVRQRVPSGGELALSARQFRRSSNVLKNASTDLEVNSGLVLTFKQPLLRGRGRQITETDRRVAEIEAVVTQWQFRQQMQKVMAEGLSAFWQAQAASQAADLRQVLQRSAEAMLADAEERLAAGRLAPRMVSEARRLLLQRQSESIRAQQGRDELLLRLLSSVDLPHQRLGDLQLLAQPTPGFLLAPVFDDRQALAQWAPYRIAALRQEQGQVRLVFARNQQRPAVDLVVSHTQTGLADTQGSWSSARSGRFPEWFVGINAELGAYGNGRARAQAQAQAQRVQQSETEQRAIEQTFLNDLQARREAMRALEQERLLVQDDLTARAQFFEQEKERVALGVAAFFSQIQAEQDLLEARIRLADVSARRETARLSLLLAEGSLLEAHAVETPLPSKP